MDFCSIYHFIFDRKIRVAFRKTCMSAGYNTRAPQPNVTGRQNPTCNFNTGYYWSSMLRN